MKALMYNLDDSLQGMNLFICFHIFIECFVRLLTAQFKTEFKHIPGDTLKLLQELNHECSTHNGIPSADILRFIDRIDLADPSAEDNEDNMNVSWGHSQFTSGGLTCSTVLVSWSAVGNVVTAFQLLAAAVKTAKVARQLCFTQGISDTRSYLADAYIQNIIELLWKCWNEVCFLLIMQIFTQQLLATSFCRGWTR
jgi:hypothetical protein